MDLTQEWEWGTYLQVALVLLIVKFSRTLSKMTTPLLWSKFGVLFEKGVHYFTVLD